MSLKKIFILSLGLISICGLAFLSLNKENSDKNKSEKFLTKEQKQQHQQATSVQTLPQIVTKPDEETSPSQSLVSEDFKKEALIIKNLSENYPQSKRDLMALLVGEQEKSSPAPAHSPEEIAQNKKGALKVLALKVLVENEKDKKSLYRDLNEISERSFDPVLVRIVDEVLKSDKEGRSFFDDFSEAISNMPL